MNLKVKKYTKFIGLALALLLALSIAGISGIYLLFKGSLPSLSGSYPLKSLKDPVTIERDARGIPSLYGSSRLDIAQALGYIHAQDRFFQMDLLRRACAGELSELFGAAALEFDKSRRFHQMRSTAQFIFKHLKAEDKQLLETYTEGINSGLSSLSVRPFEYLLLWTEPQKWKPEDTVLVCLVLFFELQDSEGQLDRARGYMKTLLPDSVYNFFIHNGSAWEAALDSTNLPLHPIPPSESFAYLDSAAPPSEDSAAPQNKEKPAEFHVGGSNQWAVRGKLIKEEQAILACDMHLRLSLPNIWYRAGFIYPDASGGPISIDGATLPGTPFMIIGSNRHIAWGFTNACVDSTDLILIDRDDSHPHLYMTPAGLKEIENQVEWIKVKGQDPVAYSIKKTVWGPILEEDFLGQAVAISWIAHRPDCINMNLLELETVKDVKQALEVSKKIRIPILNFMVADKEGHIGWSLIGTLPDRMGFDGTVPISFADGTKQWKGLKDTKDYPFIMDPPQHYLWTANNRCLGGEWAFLLGKTGFLNGVRAYQIQKKLRGLEQITPAHMLDMQMDNEAIFFDRWQRLMLDLLNSSNKTDSRQALKTLIKNWNHRCESDSAAYYWIRHFRKLTMEKILTRILAPCFAADPAFPHTMFDFEEPIWLIISEKPVHLLDRTFNSWNEELLAYIDEMIKEIPATELKHETWGKHNTLKMHHPLHEGLPFFKEMLRTPPTPVSGDYYVLRVHGISEGASQRMAVIPGKEEQGIFETPGGQSGHPLSPHFQDSHEDWLNGHPTPFLPGKTINTLILTP
jgi:penicillin amidase